MLVVYFLEIQHNWQAIKIILSQFNLQKMTSFVLKTGILFVLNFVSFPCEGQINLPPKGDTFYVLEGSNVEIAWTFNVTMLLVRTWRFVEKNELLASIIQEQGVMINQASSLSEVNVTKPATLVLKNVDISYNGTYSFTITADENYPPSYVTVFILVKPTVIIICSTPTTMDEGRNVTCLCKEEGGNPPANVTWYKDDVKHGETKDEQNMLTLTNVTGADNGTYNCVAQSYTLRDEEPIQVKVRPNFSPVVKSVLPSEMVAVLGKSFTITCVASGRPAPSYIMKHNAKVVSFEKKTNKHTILTVKDSHAGSYECIAKNKLGESSKTFNLTVIGPGQTTTVKVPTTSSSNEVESGRVVVVWHAVVFLLSGFIIGVLLSCIVLTMYFRRRYILQSNPEQQTTSKVDSIYEDLDLSKINQEENYQSLGAVNSGNGENESDYTELNLTKGAEDNYQTLTSS